MDTFDSLFEEDYLVRTLGRIAHDPDIAITELVANAWDAGASKVDIIVPTEKNNALVISDDGHGMTDNQFKERWMKLGYNRIKHQGNDVEFPAERSGGKRKAYGRNGVGRHGLICFSDNYEVKTKSKGIESIYKVGTRNLKNPFYIESSVFNNLAGNGTRLSVNVEKHLPDADKIREILSARFLHDPQFVVSVNGKSVSLPEHSGLVERATLTVKDSLTVEAFVVDSTKTAQSTLYQGVAFWVNNRLVGVPSWIVGNSSILDGRSRFAKRYAIVIKASNDWISEVEPD